MDIITRSFRNFPKKNISQNNDLLARLSKTSSHRMKWLELRQQIQIQTISKCIHTQGEVAGAATTNTEAGAAGGEPGRKKR